MKTKGNKHTIQIEVWTSNEEYSADYINALIAMTRAMFGEDWEMYFDKPSTAAVKASMERSTVVDTHVEGDGWSEVKAS